MDRGPIFNRLELALLRQAKTGGDHAISPAGDTCHDIWIWFEHDRVRANLLPGRMRAGRQPLRDDWSEPEDLQVRPMLSRFARHRRREWRRRGCHIPWSNLQPY